MTGSMIVSLEELVQSINIMTKLRGQERPW